MKKFFSALFFIPSVSYAINAAPLSPPVSPSRCPTPWFTGPLITPSGHVVPKGFFNLEPYFYYTSITGHYDDDWNFVKEPLVTVANFSVPLYIGLTKKSDFYISPSATWTSREGVSTLRFNDLAVRLEYQLLLDSEENRLPGIKLYIRELFPTGKYQKLSLEKLETDIGGFGSFETSLGAIITRLFELPKCHWLSFRFNTFVFFPTSVHVRGLNAYGGADDTDATIKPGMGVDNRLGLEYTLTQNWVLAMDATFRYQNKISFSGFPGTRPDGKLAPLGDPPSFSFTLAPAIEYNFNDNIGIISGVWFTVAGRNSAKFYSAVLAINYFGPFDTIRKKNTPPQK